MSHQRLASLIRFYSILDQLERKLGGARTLADCRGRMAWPARGVYFFRGGGEIRSDNRKPVLPADEMLPEEQP